MIDNGGYRVGSTDRALGFDADVMPEHSVKMVSERKGRKIRKQAREDCSIIVDYVADRETFHDFIRNISAGGVFIETVRKFAVGQEIVLTFTMPRYPNLLKIKGEVIRTDHNGIAVGFRRNDKNDTE